MDIWHLLTEFADVRSAHFRIILAFGLFF